jgi:FkbM family methyltransferase
VSVCYSCDNMPALCLLIAGLLCLFCSALQHRVSIPVSVAGVEGNGGATYFADIVFEPKENPLKKVRKFCRGYNIDPPSCAGLWAYALGEIDRLGMSTSAAVTSSADDTIVVDSEILTLRSVLTWGGTEFKINLEQLGKAPESAVLLLRGRELQMGATLREFCSVHALCGQMCEELHFEVKNYYTSLHYKPGGASLRNLFAGMHYLEDTDNLNFLLDVVDPVTQQVGRFYFHSIATYYSLTASRACERHRFSRQQCAEVFQYAYVMAQRFNPDKENEVAISVYVYRVLEHLVQQRLAQSNGSAAIVDMGGTGAVEDFIDMDFIEIGTSNFNTISQMLDVNDPPTLRGLAVEPSAEYLAQLPERVGVTKVNAAVVTEAEHNQDTNNSQQRTVDLYHIPESVIESEGLAQFLKGCNSIGDYHAMQKLGGYIHFVQIAKVPALTIRQLLTEYRVRRIRLLKIDAEGYDITILRELYVYLVARKDPTLYPERILFESNDKNRAAELEKLIADFLSLGYRLVYTGDDTIIEHL